MIRAMLLARDSGGRQAPDALALRIFANCNPVWIAEYLERFEATGDEAGSEAIRKIIEQQRKWYGRPPHPLPPLFAWDRKGHPIYHVFPVVRSESPPQGLMIGLTVRALPMGSPWYLSDAFGRMGFSVGDQDHSSSRVLYRLLQFVEEGWHELTGSELPLRWRCPLEIFLISPVHLDLVNGESLQIPLLIALLRAAASTGNPKALPWGDVPVFATGRIGVNGRFEPVEHLEPKLSGFLREYGEGLPAVLTPAQEAVLSSDLRKRVNCISADSVAALLKNGELRRGLEQLAGRPRLSEIDLMIEEMERLRVYQEFDAVERLGRWLTRHLETKRSTARYYRCLLSLRLADMASHAGNHEEAVKGITVLRKPQIQEILGVELYMDHLARQAMLQFAAGYPERGITALESFKGQIGLVSPKARTAYWGTLSQLYRAAGHYDEAVEAGRKAVQSARRGCVGELHRDLNYLVHALIVRAKNVPSRRRDLLEAERKLGDSMNQYAPPAGTKAWETHKLFCLHLEAELARLRSVPFTVTGVPDGEPETWYHGVLFALLSVARNPRNPVSERQQAMDLLVEKSREWVNPSRKIFSLFEGVYRIYGAYLKTPDARPRTRALQIVLAELQEAGLGGWRARLLPILREIEQGSDYPAAVEQLCDAVYFH